MRCAMFSIPTGDLSSGGRGVVIRYGVLLIALLPAAGDWLAVARGWRRLEYVCKPATMFALLVGAWVATRGPHDAWQAQFFLPGLALSLVGDVFLMLRRERLFLAGLIAFLLAHVCYVAGFNSSLPPWPSLVVLIPIAGIGAVLFRRLARGLRERDQRRMMLPVAVYSLVISVMLFSAWSTPFRPAWEAVRSSLAVVGGSLFFVSDAILAWDRFVRSFPTARLWVHMAYHLGQLALEASILLTT